MNCKNAIFDLDGTLIDSMLVWRKLEIEAIEQICRYSFSNEEKKHLTHIDYSVLFPEAERITSQKIDTKPVIEKTYELITRHYLDGKFTLKPYAKEYLTSLKKSGIKTAIATATPKYLCIPFLEKTGLIDYIDFVFTTQDDTQIKKSSGTAVYEMALNALGADKENTYLFEDVFTYIKMCKNSGYSVIAVNDFLQDKYKNDICSIADKYIYSYKELM